MDNRSSLTFKSSGEHWNWQGDGCFQNESNVVTLNEEDLSYMCDEETTPVKACGDLAYNMTYSGNMNKEPEGHKENSLQVKRHRMLRFDTPVVDPTFQYEELSSTFIKSNGKESLVEDVYNDMSEWVSTFSGSATAYGVEGLDLSTEGWISECFNDNEMHFNPTEMNYAGANDVEIDIAELCNFSPETEVNVDHHHIKRTPPNVIFKGKKSVIHTSTKLAASIAYPFAFIKPCEFQGDTTLKDINQRILTPPSNLKQKNEDPLDLDYPTSAFSGKPVVGKTKIHTDGGRGSITIMRTKG